MAINNSQRAGFGTEFTAIMTGLPVLVGTLTQSPVIIIFDNQGSVPIAVSTDNFVTTWRTFPAGEAILLDLRANSGIAPNFTFDVGTSFYAAGAAPAVFSISYIYAKNM